MFMGLGTICPGEIPELNLVNIVIVFHASVPSEWSWSTHKHFQSPAKGTMSWGFAHCSFSGRCVRARNHLRVKLLPAALPGTPPPHAVPTHLCGSGTGQGRRSFSGIYSGRAGKHSIQAGQENRSEWTVPQTSLWKTFNHQT